MGSTLCLSSFGGVDMFSAFVQKAHKENMLIGLYCSGFGYTLESKLVPEYQKRKEYEEKGLSRYMLADSDGTILSTIVLRKESDMICAHIVNG